LYYDADITFWSSMK